MKKPFRTSFFWIVLLVGTLVILNSQGLLGNLKDVLFDVVSPGQQSTSQIASRVSNFFNYFGDIKELKYENETLRQDNQELLAQLSQGQEVLRENEFLRQQLSLASEQEYKLVLASIIGKEPTNLGRYVTINKGLTDGIKKDDPVIVSGNILVGRISEVSTSVSKVMLLIEPSSIVNTLVQETRTQGVIRGYQGTSLIMDLVLQEAVIEVGQTIIASGLSSIFKPGLVIGTIEEVVSSDAQIFQQAKILPAANFDSLEKVFVIID